MRTTFRVLILLIPAMIVTTAAWLLVIHAAAHAIQSGGPSITRQVTAERQAMQAADRRAVAAQRQYGAFNIQARQEQDAEVRAELAPECADGDITRQAGTYEGSGYRRIYIPSMWELCRDWHLPIGR